MPQSSRIKTPLKQHLYRFRIGILPLLSFIGCVILTLWLWQRQVTVGAILGEVEAKTATAIAAVAGTISDPEDGEYWQRFDQVRAGQTLARLDDSGLLARLNTINLQSQKLLADLEAARLQSDLNEISLLQDSEQERRRLTWEVERRRIEVLQQQYRVREVTSQRDSVKSTLERFEALNPRAVRPVQLTERRNELNRLNALLNDANRIFREMVGQLKLADEMKRQYPDVEVPEIDALLAPIIAERQVQEARIEEIRAEMAALLITAPIDGWVSIVHKLPGEHVMAGDEIVTIARPDSAYVVGYVREDYRVPLYAGMSVGLRLRGDPNTPEYSARVERVGPHVQQVPPHQQSDRTTPEWGSPIYIPIPAAMQKQEIRPGQLLQVIFHANRPGNG